MRNWFNNIGWFGRKSAGRPARIRRACLPVVEAVEGRTYLSFSASESGVPGPITTSQSYTVYADTTGSVSSTSDVFHWGTGISDTTVNSPSDPQSASHTYNTASTYSPSVSVTPSGGSSFTVPVTLDENFGGSPTYSGKEVANSNGATGTNNAVGMYVDTTNDYIYVLATYNSGGTNAFAITRFLPNGSVDSSGTFGSSGTKVISFDSYNDTPAAIGSDPYTGDIIVAGTCHTGFCVAAITTSGAYDTSFGSSGILTGLASGTCTGMAMLNNGTQYGYIVLVGTNSSNDFEAFEINYYGATENGFGTNGLKTVSFPGPADAYAAVEANFIGSSYADDDVILAGLACEASPSSAADFGFAALKVSDGSLDSAFGSSGKQTYNFCSGNGEQDAAFSVTVDASSYPDYRIVAGGDAGGTAAAVVLDHDGALDTSFNTTGAEKVSIGSSSVFYAVDVNQGSNYPRYIALAGACSGYSNFSGTSSDFAAALLKPNGTAASFGSSGSTATDFSGSSFNDGYDVAKAVKIDLNDTTASLDDTIIAAGQTGSTSSGGYIALARYLPSNQLVVNPSGGAPLTAQPLAAVASAPTSTSSAADDGGGLGSGDPLLSKPRHRLALLD